MLKTIQKDIAKFVKTGKYNSVTFHVVFSCTEDLFPVLVGLHEETDSEYRARVAKLKVEEKKERERNKAISALRSQKQREKDLKLFNKLKEKLGIEK